MILPFENLQIPDSEISFTFVRSSGPGGQNVNKVNSKAVLRWNFAENSSLPEAMRVRFLARFANKLTQEGELILTSDRLRDRLRNQEDCLEKLARMLLEVLHAPKPRKKTRLTRATKQKRKETKRRHSEKKRNRKIDY